MLPALTALGAVCLTLLAVHQLLGAGAMGRPDRVTRVLPAQGRVPSRNEAVAADAVAQVLARAVDQHPEVVCRNAETVADVLALLLLLESKQRRRPLLLRQLVDALMNDLAELG